MRQIDSVFVELIDITNDGVEDSVLVRVRAGDLDQPFQWTLDIRSNGRTVFHHGANDAWLDNNFGTPGFGESENRIPAKQQYYFVDLPSMVVRHVSIRDTNTLFDRSSLGGIYTVLPEELRRIGVTEEGRLKVIVDIVVERLKVGTPILEVPISPVQLDFPRIYIDEVEQFVIFYRW